MNRGILFHHSMTFHCMLMPRRLHSTWSWRFHVGPMPRWRSVNYSQFIISALILSSYNAIHRFDVIAFIYRTIHSIGRDTKFTVSYFFCMYVWLRISQPGLYRSAWNFAWQFGHISNRSSIWGDSPRDGWVLGFNRGHMVGYAWCWSTCCYLCKEVTYSPLSWCLSVNRISRRFSSNFFIKLCRIMNWEELINFWHWSDSKWPNIKLSDFHYLLYISGCLFHQYSPDVCIAYRPYVGLAEVCGVLTASSLSSDTRRSAIADCTVHHVRNVKRAFFLLEVGAFRPRFYGNRVMPCENQ